MGNDVMSEYIRFLNESRKSWKDLATKLMKLVREKGDVDMEMDMNELLIDNLKNFKEEMDKWPTEEAQAKK